jgi:hypothetical protein
MNVSDELLHQFFGGYFHQDWGLEASVWQDVINRFAHDSQLADLTLVAERIEHLLVESKSDEELFHVVQDLGCYYCAGSHAGLRSWLKLLAQELHRLGC